MLGKGKFSTVYLCKREDSDEAFAMKVIDKKQLTYKEKEFLREEIQIVKSISHPNVVEMKDVFETPQSMFIMMESIEGGELFDHIKDSEISGKHSFMVFIFYRKRSSFNSSLNLRSSLISSLLWYRSPRSEAREHISRI